MPQLTPDEQNAMRYWSVIERAAAERATTADLWSAIRDEAERFGLSAPGVTLRGVNGLRSRAAAQQTARELFNGADRDRTLDARLIAEAPWQRADAEQASVQRWQVTYQHTVLVNGEEQTFYRTSMLTGTLPDTVGELADLIDSDAMTIADRYGQQHVAVSDLTVFRV